MRNLARYATFRKPPVRWSLLGMARYATIPGMASSPSLMAQVRRSRGLALSTVASAVDCDASNLAKVEWGEQIPKRPLAR